VKWQEGNKQKANIFHKIPKGAQNTHLIPVGQIFKNEQGDLISAEKLCYSAEVYKRLSFSSRKTNRTNLRAVNANTRLCWYLFTSLYLR
jgi:hypothetical protein